MADKGHDFGLYVGEQPMTAAEHSENNVYTLKYSYLPNLT